MFEIPAAKRIKRSELFEDADSREEQQAANSADDEETASTTIPNYGFEYDIVNQTDSKASSPSHQQRESQTTTNGARDVFAFNLFKPISKPTTTAGATIPATNIAEPAASKSASASATQLATQQPQTYTSFISIRSPSPPPTTSDSSGAFSHPRPDSAYFTSAFPEAQKRILQERYAASAVSASTVLALARRPWPGASLAWRVVNLPVHRRQVVVHKTRVKAKVKLNPKAGGVDLGDAEENEHGYGGAEDLQGADERNNSRRRPRPSKKRRLLLAARSKHRQMLVDETKTKEEHEREKRNQKNRERKLKRRAKERREKAEKATTIDTATATSTAEGNDTE